MPAPPLPLKNRSYLPVLAGWFGDLSTHHLLFSSHIRWRNDKTGWALFLLLSAWCLHPVSALLHIASAPSSWWFSMQKRDPASAKFQTAVCWSSRYRPLPWRLRWKAHPVPGTAIIHRGLHRVRIHPESFPVHPLSIAQASACPIWSGKRCARFLPGGTGTPPWAVFFSPCRRTY